MAMTGFDPTIVRNSLSSVKTAYEELYHAIRTDIQTKFINKMSTCWACQRAINFFGEEFKPVADKLITNVNTVVKSVVDTMNEAATNWATTNGSTFNTFSFSTYDTLLSVSDIKENINGERGIDLEIATSTAAGLSNIQYDALSAVDKLRNAVVNCGFLGGSQATNLLGSLDSIRNSFKESINGLMSSTKQAINDTLSDYEDTEGRISAQFAGNE